MTTVHQNEPRSTVKGPKPKPQSKPSGAPPARGKKGRPAKKQQGTVASKPAAPDAAAGDRPDPPAAVAATAPPPAPVTTPVVAPKERKDKPKPKVRVAQSMAQLLSSSTVTMSNANADVCEAIVKEQYAGEQPASLRLNAATKHTHPYAAWARAQSRIHVISEAAKRKNGNYLRILCPYGSQHDIDFASRFNALAVSHNWTQGGNVMKVEVTVCYEHLFEGDAARRMPADAVHIDELEGEFDLVFTIDIYQAGDSWERGLDPAQIKAWAALCVDRSFTWVGRMMLGEAGFDPVPKGCTLEGWWTRDSETNHVNFRPDSTADHHGYGAHPSFDWPLAHRHREGLAINHGRSIGPFSIIKFVCEEAAMPVGPVTPPEGSIQKLPVANFNLTHEFVQRVGGSLKHIDSFMPVEWRAAVARQADLLVHIATLTSLSHTNQVVLNGTQMSSIRHKVNLSIGEDPLCEHLARMGQHVFLARLRNDTAVAVMFRGRQQAALALIGHREADTPFNDIYARALARVSADSHYFTARNIAIATSPIWLTAAAVCILHAAPAATGFVIGKGIVAVANAGKVVLASAKAAIYAHSSTVTTTQLAQTGSTTSSGFSFTRATHVGVRVVGTAAAAVTVARISPRAVVRGTSRRLSTIKHALCPKSKRRIPLYEPMELDDPMEICAREPASAFAEYAELLSGNPEVRTQTSAEWRGRALTSRPVVEQIPVGSIVPATFNRLSDLPDTHSGKLSITMNKVPISLDAFRQVAKPGGGGEFYPVVLAGSTLGKPSADAVTVLNSVMKRLLPKDFRVVDDIAQREVLQATRLFVTQNVPPAQSTDVPTHEEIMADMQPMPAKRYALTLAEEAAGRVFPHEYYKKKLMIKGNEIVKADPAIKARLLDNLNPAHTIRTVQPAKTAMCAIKRAFDGSIVYRIGSRDVRIVCASGASETLMDSIAELVMESHELVIPIAGDDVTFWYGDTRNDISATEVDQSMFDLTQDEKVLEATAWLLDYLAGVCELSESAAKSFFKAGTSKCPIRASDANGNDFKFVADNGSRAPTGSGYTTVMNYIASLSYVVAYCSDPSPAPCPVSTGERLGFVTTHEDHLLKTDAVFLKSTVALRKDGTHGFVCLPSQVIKMGKVMTDPILTQGTKDPHLAARRTCAAFGTSMPLVADDHPVLGSYLRMMRRMGAAGHRDLAHNPYKLNPGGGIERVPYLEFMCRRYETSHEEIFDLECLFDSISAVPVFYTHPLIIKMANRDYLGLSALGS